MSENRNRQSKRRTAFFGNGRSSRNLLFR